ncbi:hypothetical protein DIS24_g10693 [Lasiodiplodia hormozganensis]|uniref:Uncharacterized protein n=1 Tax=Lasiodiplodia hormozganensis TaxID=869390 RepID=A0AA39XP03_9PEZI|nr:hypothetical protein DIS24_g10693 [Lasiodiplodia hormozganensis]
MSDEEPSSMDFMSDGDEESATSSESIPHRLDSASLFASSPPGVNNGLPYSAKGRHLSIGNLPKTHHVHDKRMRNNNMPHQDSSSSSTRRPQKKFEDDDDDDDDDDDPKTALAELWGRDVEAWLPPELPYPRELMRLDRLHTWPPDVVSALAELAKLVGSDDAEQRRRTEALDHVATAVAVRRAMAHKMKTGGEFVVCTDVEYAISQMMVDVGEEDEDAMVRTTTPSKCSYSSGAFAHAQSGIDSNKYEHQLPAQELRWVNNNWEGNLNQARPTKKRRYDPELGSEEGSVCSDGEIPDGVDFDSFRLQKRNAALKTRVAELKGENQEVRRELDGEKMRREDAERFIAMTRTSISRYLGEPKRGDPEKYLSDTRNSMTVYLSEAKRR